MSELAKQLSDYKKEFLGKASDAVIELFEQKTKELEASGIGKGAVGIGTKAPDFKLEDATGEERSLSDALANGPVVLSFYRGGWCPYCNIELRALQQLLPEFETLNASLIAISPETPDNSLSTQEKNELTFSVLSDIGNLVAKKFGLLFSLAEELRPIYLEFGIDVPRHNGDESYELPLPATYVIDQGGIIRYAFVDADYTQRAEPSEVLAAVKALAH